MKLNKAIGIAILGASIVGQQLAGAPLKESQVAAEAKWLAHIDLESVMKSPFGGMMAEALKSELAKGNRSKVSVDVDLVLAELKSVTAYGTSFDPEGEFDGVVVMETGSKLPAILDGFLAHETLTRGDESSIKLLEDKPYTTYLVGGELYLANPRANLILASKSFEQIETAFAVVKGDAPSAAKAKTKLLLNRDAGFVVVATAVGLDQLKDLPPQARILQKTTGVQVSLGLNGPEFRANVTLGAASSQVAEQLHRIVQGMLALASFAQVDNEGLSGFMEKVVLTKGEDFVAVDFRHPIEDLMRLLEKIDDRDKVESGTEG